MKFFMITKVNIMIIIKILIRIKIKIIIEQKQINTINIYVNKIQNNKMINMIKMIYQKKKKNYFI